MDELSVFERWLREQDRSEVTVRGYLADVRRFAAWYRQTNGEEMRVEAVTPTDVCEYRDWLKRHCAASTVRRRLKALRAFARWGVESKRAGSDPTARVRAPSGGGLQVRWLTKREQYALEREVERGVLAAETQARHRLAVRDRALVVLLLNTGLRISEACALEMQDVEMGERSGWVTVRSGKGGRERRVPLNREARQALGEWLSKRGEAEGAVFAGLTPSGAQRRLGEIGRRAGVEVHPHTLRHTFAKNLVDRGVGLERVAMLLGHSSLNTTRVYVVPGERDLVKAVEVLE